MKQTLIGLALGLLLSSVRCMGVQPAHAWDQTPMTDLKKEIAGVSSATREQTKVLERLVRAVEGCRGN